MIKQKKARWIIVFFTGQISLFSSELAPKGWLLCDGSSYSLNEYSDLFNLIKFSYGGNHSTTFAIPNLMSSSLTTSNGKKIYYYICASGVYPNKS